MHLADYALPHSLISTYKCLYIMLHLVSELHDLLSIVIENLSYFQRKNENTMSKNVSFQPTMAYRRSVVRCEPRLTTKRLALTTIVATETFGLRRS